MGSLMLAIFERTELKLLRKMYEVKMCSEAIQKAQNFCYYRNDGAITRADLQAGIFESRNYGTGLWQKTQDPKLVQKMMMGKGALPSQEKADQLFSELKKRYQ